jgi:membrane-bound metal-dependent hydrolase YbcI (DUF457 family)
MSLMNVIILVLVLLSTTIGFSSMLYPWVTDKDFTGLRKDPVDRFIDLNYFSIVSFSTAGYGDIAPSSSRARIAVSLFLLFVNIAAIVGIYNAVVK